MRNVILVMLVGAFGLATTGCAKASKEDCSKAYAKVVEFESGGSARMKTALEAQSEVYLKECVDKIAKSETDCLIAASDKAAYEKCKGE